MDVSTPHPCVALHAVTNGCGSVDLFLASVCMLSVVHLCVILAEILTACLALTHPHDLHDDLHCTTWLFQPMACLQGTGKLQAVEVEDWTQPTIDSWRHSIWVGVYDPWIVVFKGPVVWYRTMREIVTLERMHRAFDKGLMQYGMMKAVKSNSHAADQQTSSRTLAKAQGVKSPG